MKRNKWTPEEKKDRLTIVVLDIVCCIEKEENRSFVELLFGEETWLPHQVCSGLEQIEVATEGQCTCPNWLLYEKGLKHYTTRGVGKEAKKC